MSKGGGVLRLAGEERVQPGDDVVNRDRVRLDGVIHQVVDPVDPLKKNVDQGRGDGYLAVAQSGEGFSMAWARRVMF